ncbi:MAG TPA: HAMP domain-containing sensor histidine kinase [Longimicrobiales bacterium]|nr:HAMP domain-containing sensor histidine kinase [Longimicrobiales bacterium]
MHSQLAAAIAFTALGSNMLGAVIYFMLNPRSPSVRWYMPFQSAIVLWLLAQGIVQLWPSPEWLWVEKFAVTILPLLFLNFAWMQQPTRPNWQGVLILTIGGVLVPFAIKGVFSTSGAWATFGRVWMMAGWMIASIILWKQRHTHAEPTRNKLRARIVLTSFLLIAPLSVVVSIGMGGYGFVLFGIPIITVAVQLLMFYGMIRLQFYDVQVRVRRSGDIATEATEVERLAVLGELAATIAHEVRNPLTGVRSLAQRIADDDVTPEKRRRYSEVILEETARVERLVGNLLELSKRSPRTDASLHATTTLAPLFEDMELLVASRAQRAGVTVAVAAPQALTVKAPREALAQVLLNLTLNAISHTPHGARVELSAERDGDNVRVIVTDQGKGIPESERERIFDAFYTTSVSGTGLGLSVVRHLVREHEWQIVVDDAPNGGARFTLMLPMSISS